jgi:hypothetical protein
LKFTNFRLLVFLNSLLCPFQLIEEEKRGRSVELSEFSSEDDEEDVGSADEKDCELGSDSSSSGSDAKESSEHEEGSPKVDITS